MSIVLTKKQEQGLREAVARYESGEKYTVISGFAGSGKSTLVKFIIEALHVDPQTEVAYVAFTGKAASVLAQKGCPNATTAHKLLYRAKPMPNGTYKFIPRDVLEKDIRIVVVDEVSMLSKDLWKQLLKHPVYVIALGDPFQLPPINPDDDNHILDKPHVFLDEIMRQAQDSEIIRLSMWIREGKPLITYPCSCEQVQVIHKNDVITGMYEWADQILCATNRKREDVNRIVRELLIKLLVCATIGKTHQRLVPGLLLMAQSAQLSILTERIFGCLNISVLEELFHICLQIFDLMMEIVLIMCRLIILV